MGSPYDFKIDTLEFRAAIKDDTPYARSTAPFRKDQIDTSANAGDNSLTGWWTRGQFSFHEGAGIKYYEVGGDSGDTLNRFSSSINVNTDTPGEASLDLQWAPYTTPALTPVAGVSLGGSPSQAIIINEQAGGDVLLKVDWAGNQTQVALSDAATPTCVASDPQGNFYAVSSLNNVEKFDPNCVSKGTLYSSATKIEGIWWAKGRLWLLASNGDVYAVSDSPDPATTPVALATPQATLGHQLHANITVFYWAAAFAAGGTAVYLSDQTNQIYGIGISQDGSIPTLTEPVIVAELPADEIVLALYHYLGQLVISTSHGVRVATETSNGSLIYGPLLFTWLTTNGWTMAGAGTSVYVLGSAQGVTSWSDGRTSLYEINLGFPVGQNAFAWREAFTVPDGGYFGVLTGRSFWTNGAGVYFLGTVLDYPAVPLATSGTLTTGYHRFGTLDSKIFSSVVVKTAGDGGQVEVRRVNADGSETPLGPSGAVAAGAEATVPLLMSGATERIALRFVLTPDATDPTLGPTLLGYQLKALPAPDRQRLLKWPLQLTDTWRDRYRQGHGRQGRAWEDLQALEALESSKAIVPFEDYRTGETGNAYIDSVEFQSDTPSTPTSNGFGGITYVQLRVIS